MTNSFAIASKHLTRRLAVSTLLAGLLVLAGCSSTGGGGSSSTSSGGSSSGQAASRGSSADKTSSGVIASIRQISLHEDRASEAAASTSLSDNAVNIAPSHVSSPKSVNQGRTLSMVGNAVLSSVTGDNTDDRAPVADGQEITVRLEGGGTRVVVQPSDSALRVNQKVQIVTSNGPTRVRPD